MSQRAVNAVTTWRTFASSLVVSAGGKSKTWAQYIQGNGYVDEERVVQPTAFPAFAQAVLGWQLQVDLAPEETGVEGKPDFTPADSVTHPFVFETKGTKDGTQLDGHEVQVTRYLKDGAPRIKTVVLTNLVGAKVYDLDEHRALRLRYQVDFRAVQAGTPEQVGITANAGRLADFLDEFSRKHLTADEKIAKVRSAPPWNPIAEVTSSDWILGRIDRIVTLLTGNVLGQIKAGALTDTTRTTGDERKWITDELHLLAARLGEDAETTTLSEFVVASESSVAGKALQQFAAHVAYYAATRLMLVRVWEDLGLLEPMLHDGGFDRQMTRFDDTLNDVVYHSFTKARDRYRSLFDQRNSYTWFQPDTATYTDVIYELANTYLGAIESDVLGQVYERLLERIDRKLLGVYYTPRDVISLIWDLIGFDGIAEVAEADDRAPRVLDIATGSGGFLVEAARRMRDRVSGQRAAGAAVPLQEWINSAAEGLNGVELNRFSAYLAELNLLVQFGQVIAGDPALRLPPMGVVSADTLSLHNPDLLPADWHDTDVSKGVLSDDEDRKDRARRLTAAASADFLMDVACGNPPYIGEKTAAPMTARTRRDYPYWEQFVGQHMDYLYWFLILGVSKLRAGGRFGFITSEYWLRAEGAKPLRQYLAKRCHIDRIVLFRDFRPFPDAQGHHSMIVTGTRIADDDQSMTTFPALGSHKPTVSVYEGGPVIATARERMLSAIRDARSAADVRTFTARRSPNDLLGEAWGDVVLTQSQLRQRAQLTKGDQVDLSVVKGNETTANNVTEKTEDLLSVRDLNAVGGAGTRAGIQLLTGSEKLALGALTPAEEAVVRRVVNTRDIYPYAVVLPEDPDWIIYLAKPDQVDRALTNEQVITGTPFPVGMPHLEAHLKHFRSLLEAKTRSHGERRPWWTLHRPRVDSTTGSQGWADYCVLSRWGAGGRLSVGRPPIGTSPASGLHVLTSATMGVPAGYLAALYNSTLYQEIAGSLPPGQLRKAELQRIGVPLRPAAQTLLVAAADTLADLVQTLVVTHGPRFPQLGESLRANVALTDLTDDVWSPKQGPSTSWGTLRRVPWVHSIQANRSPSSPLGLVHVTDDVLGRTLEITARGTDKIAVTVALHVDVEAPAAQALAAAVRAVTASGGRFSDVREMPVPLSMQGMVDAYAGDRASLRGVAAQYRAFRREIDDVLEAAL